MEIAKALFTESGDERRRVLTGGTRLVFELLMVRYQIQQVAQPSDNDTAIVALSTRSIDQVEDSTIVGQDVLGSDPSIFGRWGYFYQAPTQVGLNTQLLVETIIFPGGLLVPWLAVLWNETASGNLDLTVEMYFNRRRVGVREAAELVMKAGGRART